MFIRIVFLCSIIFAPSVFAVIPYCPGTQVNSSKHQALQKVVRDFAKENHCVIGKNCLHNFDTIKYHISWAKGCLQSAARDNDPRGSTFICSEGVCSPFGFFFPEAFYDDQSSKNLAISALNTSSK
ncbi:MAG: hypothetical protein H0U73_03890 [Tatlockia sp.]|nr:hypothetical protein [Tatlockia sp.]